MKRILSTAIAISFFGLAAFASEFSPEDLLSATQVALKTFSAENPDHVAHVSGFKTWKSGADSKVKIYVAHDGMTMEYNYLCQNQNNQIAALIFN
jgi:hypothetical protein